MVAFDKNSSVFMQTLFYLMNQSNIVQDTSYNYYYMQIGQETKASKCYGIYGCFELNYPWTSENRPVAYYPEEIEKIEPQYLLLTRQNPVKPIIMDLNDFDYDDPTDFDPEKPIYIITHGYMERGSIGWIQEIATALLRLEDCSVIIIDWQRGSGPPYTQAVANIRLVGAMTAYLLADLAKFTYKNLDHVHAIGHSLGAHLCGYIGYTLQKEFNLTLGRITGMDPAEPHFSKAKPPVRLDRTAAKYVDVVHTDASQFIRGGLGILESIGHVDYYPNGGTDQPGCTKGVTQYIRDANGSLFNGVKKYLACNHVRSHEYFLDSITPDSKCKYLTISCQSFQDFTSGRCFGCSANNDNCIPFGFHSRKHYDRYMRSKWSNTSRIQYFITGENRPFCKHHYRITVQVSNSNQSRAHGGEIGQLVFTMHGTSDGRGSKTEPIGFISGFHEPGELYTGVVATDPVPHLKAIEIEWKYNSSLFNPLTWRILTTPKIFLKKITVEGMEIGENLTVCPKHKLPLANGIPQLLIPSYC
ncbi:pancreatic triacylglycerol lipase-like isoform X2 [Diorhabda carinulata]|uniref:pancreatic triacylglycerol lipase-like isoform X2 n=1 Tax=Diorhabda sublineata TaxID=1163346 RepID=UPI0024E0E3D5|nr:pancreatic triacylglycerol lipase-like isoform X2 [Diorhabda sublineata]XP_057656544.1 pancreatic triacylglycerol lipase-like isoform X2 [Diorhabda carinulata]